MGIEQNKQGAFLPDKNTPWPKMTPEERSKVYGSLKETYAGPLKNLDTQTGAAKKKLEDKVKKDLGMEANKFWDDIRSHEYSCEYRADDPKLKGQPVSMALMLAFQKIPSGNAEKLGIKGKEKELMFFCLDYLQNAAENKAKNPNGRIDFVPKNGRIKIEQQAEEVGDRWLLKIEDAKGKPLYEGFLFP